MTTGDATTLAAFEGFMVTDACKQQKIDGATIEDKISQLCDVILECISSCPMDLRREFWANITVSGIGLLGFGVENEGTRAEVAIQTLEELNSRKNKNKKADDNTGVLYVPPNAEVKVVFPKEYKYSSWIGASVLAGLSMTAEAWYRLVDRDDDVASSTELQFLYGSQKLPNAYWAMMRVTQIK